MKKYNGIITKGLGGLYEVRLDLFKDTVICGARGIFRHENISPLIGDRVCVEIDESYTKIQDGQICVQDDINVNKKKKNKKQDEMQANSGMIIDEIFGRKNSLIRPPIANIDVLFIVISAAMPVTIPQSVDKLISIAEFNKIEPVIIITKKDLDSAEAIRLQSIYKNSGFTVFTVSSLTGEDVDNVKVYLKQLCSADKDKEMSISAFAGASGAGKSSLMNAIFPKLNIATNTVSRKIERGRHTTRHVELFPMKELLADKEFEIENQKFGGYLADTPGFSMLDFTRFDFFNLADLQYTFREFFPYIGKCRYTKCTHLKEEGCAVLEAMNQGKFEKNRHDSYVAMYEDIKQKPDWKRDKDKESKNTKTPRGMM